MCQWEWSRRVCYDDRIMSIVARVSTARAAPSAQTDKIMSFAAWKLFTKFSNDIVIQTHANTMNTYYVYIVKCKDNSYYTGVTNDIERRIAEHNSGIDKNSYTFSRKPVELMFTYEFNDINQAIAFEKQLKGWSRKKKEAVISGDWDILKVLAECRNESHSNNKRCDKLNDKIDT